MQAPGSTPRTWWRTPLPWLAGVLALYLLSPIGDFLGRLATSDRVSSPGTGSALAVSIETATVATVIIAIVGTPLAYLLARGRSRASATVGVAVQLPIALPPLMSGILLLYLVGPFTTLGRLFGGRLTDDRAGIVLAQIFVAGPFLVVAARSSFAALDPGLEDVAATLGLGAWSIFWRVSAPAAMPGIVAGLLLAWLRAFGEFGATVILAYHPYSLPVFTYVQFGSTGLSATLLPVAATLGASLIVLLLASAAAGRSVSLPRGQLRPAADAARPAAEPSSVDFAVTGQAGSFLVSAQSLPTRRLAILGPTGAGKTLTMRMIAGLVHPTSGTVRLDGVDVTALAAQDREVGYVPQDSSLFPNEPVRRQVGFGEHVEAATMSYWMDRLGLRELADRRPHQLSGGQRRRVALARALATHPRLLLLDEPFTGLDTPARDDLRRELRQLEGELAPALVIVTHDPQDAVMLADHVLVLDHGRTLQAGPLAEVVAAPVSRDVARLLGVVNAFVLHVVDRDLIADGSGLILSVPTDSLPPGTPVMATVDPRGITVRTRGGTRGAVTAVVDIGPYAEVDVALSPKVTLRTQPPLSLRPHVGDAIGCDIDPVAVRLTPLPDGEGSHHARMGG